MGLRKNRDCTISVAKKKAADKLHPYRAADLRLFFAYAKSMFSHDAVCLFICFMFQSVVEWSTEKYAAVFNSFSDNVAGKSFRERYTVFNLK